MYKICLFSVSQYKNLMAPINVAYIHRMNMTFLCMKQCSQSISHIIRVNSKLASNRIFLSSFHFSYFFFIVSVSMQICTFYSQFQSKWLWFWDRTRNTKLFLVAAKVSYRLKWCTHIMMWYSIHKWCIDDIFPFIDTSHFHWQFFRRSSHINRFISADTHVTWV